MQRGFTLLEVIVAVAIVAAIGVAFMTALSSGHKSVGIIDEHQFGEVLARSQLEGIKDAAYQTNGVYPVTVDLPYQYTMNITVTAPTQIGTTDNNTSLNSMWGTVTTIQEITVKVFHGNKLVSSVAEYKVE